MINLLKDLRFAVRTLARKPGFSLTIVGTLALALGANAAVFSIVDALVLNPFPIPGIERLVMLWETVPQRGEDRDDLAPANFLDWSAQSGSLQELVAFYWWDANLSDTGEPERLQGTRVTPGFLELLGVTAASGRLLATDRAEVAQDQTVVISHGLWQRRFGGDPAVVGSEVLINGERFVIVGVAQENFEYPYGSEVWAPMVFTPEEAQDRASHYLQVIGRLAPGQSVAAVQRELDVIASRLAAEFPATNDGRGARAQELSRAVVDIGAPAFLAVWQVTVICILLIACINVAGLLLARGSDRYREMSLRAALGAGRWHIVRQLLTENLVLSLSGSVLALPLAWASVDVLRSAMPARIRRFVVGWDQIDIDLRVLAVTVGLAVLATLVFGLVPALTATRSDVSAGLREGARGVSSGSWRQRWRTALVVGQVSVALMLLVASGLSIRGTLRAATSDQGYVPAGVMSVEIDLPERVYPDPAQRRQFYQSLVESLQSTPDVEAATAANVLPSSGSGHNITIEIEGQPLEREAERPVVHYRVITPGFFDTLRIPLTSGRAFTPSDRADSAPVAIVSRKLAERFWPGENAIGRRLRFGREDNRPWATIVGITGDVTHDWFLGGPQPTLYVPFDQFPRGGMRVAVRMRGDETGAAGLIRETVRKIDPNQAIFNEFTMSQLLWDRMLGLRYAASVMAVFGGIALLLSGVGLYGLMAYTVSRRTHEIGVRVALGAGRQQVLRLVLKRGIAITIAGVAAGLLLAWVAGSLMASTLFGTVLLEPSTFLIFAGVLVAASLLATYLPARRALSIDPVEALRVE